MSNLALAWNAEHGCADLVFSGGSLALDDGLSSVVLASLLTDARADVVELPEDESDRRGWWGDALEGDAQAASPWGSPLWTLRRAKTERETLRKAEDYARRALAWMIGDGIVASVDVTATRLDGVGSGAVLAFSIVLHKPDGTREALLYDRLWQATATLSAGDRP